MRVLAFWLGLTMACVPLAQPLSRYQTDNKEIVVDTLFNHDGCTVYRFRDGGSTPRYLAKCATAATVSWDESCGKNCVANHSITTANEP